MKPRHALLLLAALPLLAACGLQKDLERPGPMFGDEKAKYEAEQARIKAEADARAASQPSKPGGDVPIPPPPRQPIPSSPIDAPKVP